MTKTLIKLYWQMGKNTFQYAPTKTKVTYGLSGVIVALFVVFFSAIIGSAAASLPDPFVSIIFSYLFAGLLGFVILIGVPQVFKDLYSSTELAHLFTLPIATRHIFWVKYGQSFIAVPGFLWLVSVILLTVYGVFAKASLLFFPVSYIATLAIILIGMAIAYMLNLVMVQIIPAHRAKELMTVMSALAGLFGYLSFQLPNFFMNGNEGNDLFANLPSMPKWLPLTWGADAIAKAKLGELSFYLPFILIILLAIVLVLLATTLVERGFRTGWIRLNEGSSKKKKRKRVKLQNKLFHPIIFIGIKEWRSVQRDMREWMNFLPFLFFMIFPIITFAGDREALEAIVAEPIISWSIAQGTLLFMITLFGATFASTTIGREANSIHLLRALPINGWHLALGKFWISWLIPFVLLTVIEVGLGVFLHWSFVQIALGALMMALYGLGITGIGLWMGTIGARHNPDNPQPQQRLKVGVSFLLMLLTSFYLIVATVPISLAFFPIESIFEQENLGVGSGGLLGLFAVIAQWKGENQLLVKTLGVLFSLFVTFGITWFTLFLSAIKINKGIIIDVVSNVKTKL